jgi:hypothetical protein
MSTTIKTTLGHILQVLVFSHLVTACSILNFPNSTAAAGPDTHADIQKLTTGGPKRREPVALMIKHNAN